MVHVIEILLTAYVFGALFGPPLAQARREQRRTPVRVRVRR